MKNILLVAPLIVALFALGLSIYVNRDKNADVVKQPTSVSEVSQVLNTKFYLFYEEEGIGVFEDKGKHELTEEEYVVPPVYSFVGFCYQPAFNQIVFIGYKAGEGSALYNASGKVLLSLDHTLSVEGFVEKNTVIIMCIKVIGDDGGDFKNVWSYFLVNIETGEKTALSGEEFTKRLRGLKS